jgi:endo-1,4-beta-xylanase
MCLGVLAFMGITTSIYLKEKPRFPLYAPEVQNLPQPEILPSVETPESTMTPTPTPDMGLFSGTWNMSGMEKVDDKFVIHPMGFALINQNGTFSQNNPSINLSGTSIKDLIGDWKLSVDLQLNNSTSATISLYGQVPIVADEFLINRESLNAKLSKNILTVTMYDGKTQKPIIQTFPVAQLDVSKFTISKTGTTFTFSINDSSVGTIADPGIFTKGTMYFGFDADEGDWSMSKLSLEKLNNGDFSIVDTSTTKVTKHNDQGLQALVLKKRPDFIVGTALSVGPLIADSEYASVALDSSMFGGITTENDLKMANTQPQKDVYSFERADALINLALQNGQKVHGHALVFGEALPLWFSALPVKTGEDKQVIEKIMTDRIITLMQHYEDKIFSWDVINEPFADEEFDASKGIVWRNHKWYQAMGKDYIIKALVTAYHANPKALLFVNEFGLEEEGERWQAFYIQMQWIKGELEKQGVPIDHLGVGFQSHVYEKGDIINKISLADHIRKLGALGIKTQISEMDVYGGDITQANQYRDVFATCLAEPTCIAWRGWILSDRYDIWKDGDSTINYGEDGLFDKNMTPRPALLQMQNL